MKIYAHKHSVSVLQNHNFIPSKPKLLAGTANLPSCTAFLFASLASLGQDAVRSVGLQFASCPCFWSWVQLWVLGGGFLMGHMVEVGRGLQHLSAFKEVMVLPPIVHSKP